MFTETVEFEACRQIRFEINRAPPPAGEVGRRRRASRRRAPGGEAGGAVRFRGGRGSVRFASSHALSGDVQKKVRASKGEGPPHPDVGARCRGSAWGHAAAGLQGAGTEVGRSVARRDFVPRASNGASPQGR